MLSAGEVSAVDDALSSINRSLFILKLKSNISSPKLFKFVLIDELFVFVLEFELFAVEANLLFLDLSKCW